MRTLILVETKKEYKRARNEISKQLESQEIEHFINYQGRFITHENGLHRIDFVINSDDKSEVESGAKYNQIITWKKND